MVMSMVAGLVLLQQSGLITPSYLVYSSSLECLLCLYVLKTLSTGMYQQVHGNIDRPPL